MTHRKTSWQFAMLFCVLLLLSTVLAACGTDSKPVSNPKPSPNHTVKDLPNPLEQVNDIYTFYYHFEQLVQQREAIDKEIPFTSAVDQQKLTQEFQQKILSGELKPDKMQEEIKKQAKKSLSQYSIKKKTYIQNLNKKAVSLKTHISKIHATYQPTARQSLDDFIALTNDEIKLYEQMSKLMEGIDLDSLLKNAPKLPSSNLLGKLLGANQACAATPQNCQCSVTTEYLSPRLMKITTTCNCIIYVQYKQTLNKVIRDQAKFRHTWNKLKTDPLGYKPPINLADAKNRLANGSLQHLFPYVTIKNGIPHIMTSLRQREVPIKNGSKAGEVHDSNVKFDVNALPVFKSYYTTRLPVSRWLDDRSSHFRFLNKQLAEHIKANPKLQAYFKQRYGSNYTNILKGLEKGKKPKGLTWNHHQMPGVMQLVDQQIHSKTGHIGGYSIWGRDQFK